MHPTHHPLVPAGQDWYDQARCYALQNNLDLAIQYLKQAISFNPNYITDAKINSDFDTIREDERFKQLLGGVSLRRYQN
ncbi:MAG: tetratricopeptide repeat protein [Verrucomicrobia bacterium]|nr:tetratricopeptide repeat protein [Leptolyngbya sp. ES-bin-22]